MRFQCDRLGTLQKSLFQGDIGKGKERKEGKERKGREGRKERKGRRVFVSAIFEDIL